MTMTSTFMQNGSRGNLRGLACPGSERSTTDGDRQHGLRHAGRPVLQTVSIQFEATPSSTGATPRKPVVTPPGWPVVQTCSLSFEAPSGSKAATPQKPMVAPPGGWPVVQTRSLTLEATSGSKAATPRMPFVAPPGGWPTAATPKKPVVAPPGAGQPRSGPRIVSLGAYCGVRKSVQKIGLDAEALPFDWMRTRIEAILHYMRNDFAGFFDYTSTHKVPTAPVVVYRDHLHSFWHDDLGDEQVMAKYHRRFARFKGLDASTEPILFVRSVAHTKELALVGELLREVVGRFGDRAMLLLIVDFQRRTLGPVFLQDQKNLLVYYLPTNAHRDPGGAPYSAPLLCALDWLEGKHVDGPAVASEQALLDMADISPEWAVEGISPFAAAPAEHPIASLAAAPSAVAGYSGVEVATPMGAQSQLHGVASTYTLHAPGTMPQMAPSVAQARAPSVLPQYAHSLGVQPAPSVGLHTLTHTLLRDGSKGAVAPPAMQHRVFVTSSMGAVQAAYGGICTQYMAAQDVAPPVGVHASAYSPTGLSPYAVGTPIVCAA